MNYSDKLHHAIGCVLKTVEEALALGKAKCEAAVNHDPDLQTFQEIIAALEKHRPDLAPKFRIGEAYLADACRTTIKLAEYWKAQAPLLDAYLKAHPCQCPSCQRRRGQEATDDSFAA